MKRSIRPHWVAARRVAATVATLAAVLGGAGTQQHDVVLRGGRVLDGSGNPWFVADIAIDGDRIVAIGALGHRRGRVDLDVQDLHVSPGFIDPHSHAAAGLTTPERSGAEPLLLQGVTSVIVNPDGGGPVDLARQREELLADGLGVNVAQLVPHGTIRRSVIGMADRPPTEEELDRMRALTRAGMDAGAFGLSSGLFYAPGSYAQTSEVIALARVVGAAGGVYASHVRDESDYSVGLVAAVQEVIDVAAAAAIPGVVTHVKALGPNVWGFSQAVIERIERARVAGVEVYADQYPYEASSTGLAAALLPRWAQAGGVDALAARLADAGTRARIIDDMRGNLARRGGPGRIQLARFAEDPALEGSTLAEVAGIRDLDPVEAALQIIQAGGASIVSFNMHERDMASFMRQPWTMTSSDGGLPEWQVGVPHPRSYGTFPRKIRRYVVEDRVMTLAAAVRSMTSLPATVFRLHERGALRPGAIADVTVFDLDRLRDRATYAEPHQLSEGVVHVLVNGTLAVRDGEPSGGRAGAVLRRQRVAAHR